MIAIIIISKNDVITQIDDSILFITALAIDIVLYKSAALFIIIIIIIFITNIVILYSRSS